MHAYFHCQHGLHLKKKKKKKREEKNTQNKTRKQKIERKEKRKKSLERGYVALFLIILTRHLTGLLCSNEWQKQTEQNFQNWMTRAQTLHTKIQSFTLSRVLKRHNPATNDSPIRRMSFRPCSVVNVLAERSLAGFLVKYIHILF